MMTTILPLARGVQAPASPADERAQIAAIMARQVPSRGVRYKPGFRFHPLQGHALVLPAEAEPLLAIADRLELKLAGTTLLAFVVAARLHDRRGEADGGWSSRWFSTIYAWHRDAAHGRPLAAESWQLPESARRLDVVVADERGAATVTRRCLLPATFASAINSRIRRIDGCDSRVGHLEAAVEVLGRTIDARDIDRLTTTEYALVDLDELPAPAAGA